MQIITNHQYRDFICGHEVPAEVLAGQFDYLEDAEYDTGFILYKGRYYHLSDFLVTSLGKVRSDWHGASAKNHCSGVLIRVGNDGKQYQIATYIA